LRKLKQVNHLVGLLQPALEDVWQRFADPVLVDCGSGSGYLGFILYELFLKPSGKGSLISVEERSDLIERAQARAQKLGFERMTFQKSAIDRASYPDRVHLLTALHACDTATDDALVASIRRGVDYVVLVPCCQAEVAAQLRDLGRQSSAPMRALFQHPWHRREFGSHLTNVVRALALEASGYQVTVTELTGWEHSLKNELILGRKVHRENSEALERLRALLAETHVRPKVARELGFAAVNESEAQEV
jgi:hypothetical protein